MSMIGNEDSLQDTHAEALAPVMAERAAVRPSLTVKSFANVQALRAFAAIAVFGIHLNVLEQRFTGSAYLNVFQPIGEWGVDLFFVISGFVMITSTWGEFGTPGASLRFLLRRLTRIYPAYLVILVPICLLYLVKPGMVNGSQAIKPDILASFLLLPQRGYPLLTVSWTLVYEMFFYVVFALVLIANRRYVLPLMAAWAVVTLGAAYLLHGPENVYLATYTSPLLLEFILGVGIGYMIKVRSVPFVIPFLVLGIVGIVLSDVSYSRIGADVYSNGMFRFLLAGVPVALIFMGAVGLERRYGWTFPGWLQVIGNASYSLYLWHAPLTVLVGRLSGNRGALHNPLIHALWLLVVAVFVIGASIVLYTFVERPLLRYFGRLLHRPLTPDARPAQALPPA